MESNLPVGEILNRGFKLAGTGWGPKIAGFLAHPITGSLRDRELRALEQEDLGDEKKPEPEPEGLEKILTAVQDHFAIGDLLTSVGLGFLALDSLFSSKSKDYKPGFVKGIIRNVAWLMTLGGSAGAFIGRSFDYHRSEALGDQYTEALLASAEKKGKNIFTKYTDAEKEKLKAKAKILDRVLVYKPGVRESILERYEQNDIGGLLDGLPGTGKTDGVYCILGKWADRIEQQGGQAVIAQLNLANFDDYIKERKRANAENIEAIEAVTNINIGSNKSFMTNQGLMVLELLVRKIQRLRNAVRAHNKQNPNEPPKHLAVFVDEFDKVFDPNTLKGCDRARLKNLLLQFNELFVDENLLLTSNVSLEKMMKNLKKHLYVSKEDTGVEVWEPMQDRISAKNRIEVEKPSSAVQAEIIAGRLLERYHSLGAIDWQDFGVTTPATGRFELDRRVLAEAIEDKVTSQIATKLNGRQLKFACDEIQNMLLGKARILRLTKAAIVDSVWDTLSAQDKIKRTGVKVNREMLTSVLRNKIKHTYTAPADVDLDKAIMIFENYLKNKEINSELKGLDLNSDSTISLDGVLSALYQKTELEDKVIYMSKKPVNLNAKDWRHVIYKHKVPNAEDFYSIAFAPMGSELGSIHSYNFTQKLSSTDLYDKLAPIITKAYKNPISDIITKLVSQTLNGSDDWKQALGLVQGLTELAAHAAV